MVKIDVAYEGDLHTTCRHGPSGRELETDAPVDNQGRGESFSPTDLLATALGTCTLTVMGIVARREGWKLEGARSRVEKHMVADPVRRVGRLVLHFELLRCRVRRLSKHLCQRLTIRYSSFHYLSKQLPLLKNSPVQTKTISLFGKMMMHGQIHFVKHGSFLQLNTCKRAAYEGK